MTPAPWHWLVLGGVLLLLEAFTMGFACLWLAVGAGLTGLLLWLVPALPWQAQVLAFALCAVGALGGWRWWRRRSPVLPAGTRVRIVGADGPVLHVVPAGEVHPDGPAAATTDRPSARA